MLVLAIDTATAATSVAAVTVTPDAVTPDAVAGEHAPTPDAVSPQASRRHVDPRGHGEQLAGLVDAVLTEVGTAPSGLAALVAGTGPGPYTGLRVGLTTAAAMGQALGRPAYGVCSLDGIGAGTTGRVLVATDARRREVYWAVYDDGERVTDPAVDRPADVAAALPRYGVVHAYGEGALRYRDAFGVPVADDPSYPDPVLLARVAAPRVCAGGAGERLTPQYLRRPHAADPHAPKPVTAASVVAPP